MKKTKLDPWKAENVRTDINLPFLKDGYTLTPEMIEKYRQSKDAIPSQGALRFDEERLFKNVSIFDVTGTKVTWGDLAPKDVLGMKGVYYVLSEFKSFWSAPKDAVKKYDKTSDDPNSRSPFRDLLPEFEPTIMDINYIKGNAIARIVDGEVHSCHELFSWNY